MLETIGTSLFVHLIMIGVVTWCLASIRLNEDEFLAAITIYILVVVLAGSSIYQITKGAINEDLCDRRCAWQSKQGRKPIKTSGPTTRSTVSDGGSGR